jgi:hypothetical protein
MVDRVIVPIVHCLGDPLTTKRPYNFKIAACNSAFYYSYMVDQVIVSPTGYRCTSGVPRAAQARAMHAVSI